MNLLAVVVGLGLLIVVLFALILQQRSSLNTMKKKYEFFTNGKDANIDQILVETLTKLQETQKELAELQKKHQALREQVRGCLQNVKIKRYDAFDAMGGEMSYSILVTDEEKNGIILTSIYGREDNRCFAKEIVKGKSKTALAEEEESLL